MTDQNKQKREEDQRDVFESEGFKQLITAVVFILTTVLSGVLILSVSASIMGNPIQETALSGPLMALFGVLITGIFVFMTFRIDRGAKHEARAEAERVAEKVAERVAKEVAERVGKEIAEVAKSRADFTAREVARKVAEEEAQKVMKEAIMESQRVARKESERIAKAESEKVDQKFRDIREKLGRSFSD